MDYTVSLQVQHQLAVFPTHFYQGYSVELQVHSFCIPLASPVFFFFFSSSSSSVGYSPWWEACMRAEDWVWLSGDALLRGKAQLSCCMLIFSLSPRFLLRVAGRRSGAVRCGGCGAHGGLKVACWRLTSRLREHAGEVCEGGSGRGHPRGALKKSHQSEMCIYCSNQRFNFKKTQHTVQWC